MKITFSVDDLPPKKDGANSMWRKPMELPRLKALRRAAHTALGGRPIPSGAVYLTLRVWAYPREGDLDNFLTGICDGLMSAHRLTPAEAPLWLDVPPEVRPDRTIMLRDDALVTRITAERLAPEDASRRYELDLEWDV
jgi:hypothetical protein